MVDRRFQRVRRLGQGVLRVALCVVVLYLGYVAVRGFAIVFRDDSMDDRVVGAFADEPNNHLPAVLLEERGYWGFAGWGWEVQQSVGTEEELTLSRLETRDRPSHVADEETRFLEYLATFSAPRRGDDGWVEYSLDLHPGRLLVLARQGPDGWIDQAMLAVPNEGGKWRICRLRRSERLLDADARSELIPLPTSVRRMAARIDEDGEVQAELFQASPAVDILRPALERSGCSVSQVKVGNGQTTWVVSRMSETFLLWEPSVEASGVLLVSRMLADDKGPSEKPVGQ